MIVYASLMQTGPMLERVEEVVLGLTRLLDARVYVALGRGLWDFTAKDVYDYVESLQEDRHNKVRLLTSNSCCPPCEMPWDGELERREDAQIGGPSYNVSAAP